MTAVATDPRTGFARLVELANAGGLDTACEKFGVRVMCAFGSATRESTLRPPDDLDIGVSFIDRSAGRRQQIALWTALVELSGCEAIDLVVLDVDDPVLRAEALTGFGLYEDVSGAFAVMQMAAMGERRDTAHLRRMNLELMAQ